MAMTRLGQAAVAVLFVLIGGANAAEGKTPHRYLVTGRVVDGGGRPVPNATVLLEPLHPQGWEQWIETHTADDEGRFRIQQDAGDLIDDWVLGTSLVPDDAPNSETVPDLPGVSRSSRADPSFNARPLRLEPGRAFDLGDVRLQRRYHALAIPVQGPDGSDRPTSADWWLRLYDRWGDCLSDGSAGPEKADGKTRLRLTLPEGAWRIELGAGDGLQGELSLTIPRPDGPAVVALRLQPPSSRAIDDISPQAARRKLESLGIPFSATEFVESARRRNVDAVALFLAAGMQPDVKGTEGQTALICAAGNEDLDSIRLLLRRGAAVNARGDGGVTALMTGAGGWDQEPTDVLLRAGADVNARAENGMTALIMAVANDRPRLVERLLKAGAALDAADENGETALMFAVEHGVEPVERLLQKGADVRVADKAGRTALHHAVEGFHWTSVSPLLKAGADALKQDRRGCSPLYHALSDSLGLKYRLVVAAFDQAGRHDPLAERVFSAIASDDRTMLAQALADGAPVDGRDLKGRTLAMRAADIGSIAALEELLAQGSALEARDDAGNTALAHAAAASRIDVVRLLLRSGARVDARSEEGETPLMHAARYCQRCAPERDGPGVVQLLIDSGADPRAESKSGLSAVDLAYEENVRSMLEAAPARSR